MKEFDKEKFCRDLVALRGAETQLSFAEKLGINRSTLSLLENGRQVPAMDIFGRICELGGKSTDDYFADATTDALVYLMGRLEESDKIRIEEMAERIRVKERYELLAKRGPLCRP